VREEETREEKFRRELEREIEGVEEAKMRTKGLSSM